MTRFGGIILCGGKSSRMGVAKSQLPFGGETLLERVIRTIAKAVQPVVVVSGADQPPQRVPDGILAACDRSPNCGPLEGIAVGMQSLTGQADAAFVGSCDAALISSPIVATLCNMLGECDAVVPVVDGHRQPLTSVCRLASLPTIEAMLKAGDRQPRTLFDRLKTRFVDEAELRRVDPQLLSMRAVNTPEEYLAALVLAGLEPPVTPRGR